MGALLSGDEIMGLSPAGLLDRARALLLAGGRQQQVLWAAADEVRRRSAGPTVHLRAILEFSNHCVQDCLYCGLRRSRAGLRRFALDPGAIVATAVAAARAGYGTIVLQSGEDPRYGRETLAAIIREIKAEAPGLAVTLSVGERGFADYRAWRQAGADRYLLKHETADARLYAALRPRHRLSARLKRASWLSGMGYAVGLGNMIGLPGQTVEALVADLHLMAAFRPEMVGSGPFLPHPDTPLAGNPAGEPELTLNFLALTRLLLPKVLLPATTALATVRGDARRLALQAGANVLMVNVGPESTRSLYEIYPDRDDGSRAWGGQDSAGIAAHRARVVAWLKGLGRDSDGYQPPAAGTAVGEIQ